MQLDKLISQTVLLIPLAHLIACSIFLLGYAAGFGGNVGTLLSLTDIFPVSIRDLALTYFAGLLVPALRNRGHQGGLGLVVLVFLVSAFGHGVDQGQRDRRMPFSFVESRYFCGSLIVLRNLSSRFIAADRQGNRVVIGDDCKPKFRFPRRAPFAEGSGLGRAAVELRGRF
jgi:hypothetical protein